MGCSPEDRGLSPLLTSSPVVKSTSDCKSEGADDSLPGLSRLAELTAGKIDGCSLV